LHSRFGNHFIKLLLIFMSELEAYPIFSVGYKDFGLKYLKRKIL